MDNKLEEKFKQMREELITLRKTVKDLESQKDIKPESTLRSIWHYITRKDEIRKDNTVWKNDDEIKASIYPKINPKTGKPYKTNEYSKKFNWVHSTLKYKILYPFIVILDKFVKNKLDNTVEDTWYNKNIKIFNDSWLEADDIIEKYMMKPNWKNHTAYSLARKSFLTLTLHDTITREFVNILMHQITKNMTEEYKGRDAYHIFYTDKVTYNPIYFTMVEAVMGEGKSPKEAFGYEPPTMNTKGEILSKNTQTVKPK